MIYTYLHLPAGEGMYLDSSIGHNSNNLNNTFITTIANTVNIKIKTKRRGFAEVSEQ